MASLESETQKSALGVEASGRLLEKSAEKSTWSEALVYSSPVITRDGQAGWYAYGACTQYTRRVPQAVRPSTAFRRPTHAYGTAF